LANATKKGSGVNPNEHNFGLHHFSIKVVQLEKKPSRLLPGNPAIS
jgi:hypothetical protein